MVNRPRPYIGNKSGMTLIETMLATALSAGLAVFMGQLILYMTKSTRIIMSKITINRQLTVLNDDLASASVCPTIFSGGSLNSVATNTATSVQVVLARPSNTPYTFSAGSPVGGTSDAIWQTSSALLTTKTVLSSPAVNGIQFYSLAASIDLTLNNLAIAGKSSFGSSIFKQSIPVLVTFNNATGTQTLVSCQGVSGSAALIETGWAAAGECTTSTLTSSACGQGLYVAGYFDAGHFVCCPVRH